VLDAASTKKILIKNKCQSSTKGPKISKLLPHSTTSNLEEKTQNHSKET
jgi:hypothetical protein